MLVFENIELFLCILGFPDQLHHTFMLLLCSTDSQLFSATLSFIHTIVFTLHHVEKLRKIYTVVHYNEKILRYDSQPTRRPLLYNSAVNQQGNVCQVKVTVINRAAVSCQIRSNF